MDVLKNSVAYLAGPIDFCPDLGVTFRQRFKEAAKEAGLKIRLLDPTHKITGTTDVNQEQARIQTFRAQKDWASLRKLMKRIVREDLRQVDISDFIVAFIDPTIHSSGTYHEIYVSESQRKPILIIVKGGKTAAPSWLFGVMDYRTIFDSIEECIEYLVKLDKGLEPLGPKWILFRKQLDDLNSA